MSERVPTAVTVVLGLVPIVAFGSWFYGYGVLIEPIRAETGWSEAALSSTYGVGLLAAGVGATLAGRLLDRRGSRLVFGLAALAAVAGHLATSLAGSPATFLVAAAATGGIVGAVGYYSVAHAVLARLAPSRRTRSITVNTLWGAFASPVFLPLMGWLVVTIDWRWTMRVTGALVAVVLLAAAVIVPDVHTRNTEQAASLRTTLASSIRSRRVAPLLAAVLLGGVATSVLFLYQVPAMVGAGLTLATATTLAGARGLLQLAGRLPLPWVVARLGGRATLRLSYALTGVSCLLLAEAGVLPVAVTFTVVAGLAVGMLAAIENIHAADVVDEVSLGTSLGLCSLVRGVGAAAGPVAGGVLVTALGSRTPALVAAAAVGVLAAWLVPAARAATSGPTPRPSRGRARSAAGRRAPGA